MDILNSAQKLTPQLSTWRRLFHAIPEVGNDIPQTRRAVCAVLADLGIESMNLEGCGGVTALLHGKRDNGHTVGLRADMDALPVKEETGLPFASTNGCMHACGHDAHMAMLLGSAKLLRDHSEIFSGTVKLIFQPGEENVRGANKVISAGALDNPKVEAIFGQHAGFLGGTGSGIISLRKGTIMASFDCFEITVTGKGGHGARPEDGIDPIVCAAQMVTAAQTLISRECAATDPAVLTFGSFRAGETYNVIPEKAFLKGALRTCNPHTRERIKKRLGTLFAGIAASMGAHAEVNFVSGYMPVENDARCTALVKEQAERLFGVDKVRYMDVPSMVSEDMSEYLSRIPGCYWLFDNPLTDEEGMPIHCRHHSADFDIDESMMWRGSVLMAVTASEWLNRQK